MLTLIHVERQNGQKQIHHDRQGALPQALFGIETGIAWQATGFGDMEKAACIRGRFFPPSRGKYFSLAREIVFCSDRMGRLSDSAHDFCKCPGLINGTSLG